MLPIFSNYSTGGRARPLVSHLPRNGCCKSTCRPPEVLQAYRQKHKNQITRLERLSTRNLHSLYYHDVGVKWVVDQYAKIYNLPPGANLMHHFYEQLGLPDWISEDTEVINFAWGAMVGMSRAAILQHPQSTYERLHVLSTRDPVYGYMTERCWFTLFDRLAGVAYEPQFHAAARTLT